MLDERFKKRRWIFDYYKKALEDVSGIEFMPEAPYERRKAQGLRRKAKANEQRYRARAVG